MAEYHKQALEEVDQIQTFEQQQQQNQQNHIAPLRPATPKAPHTHAPLAVATTTPQKLGWKFKGLFIPSPKKKKDDSTGIRRPMGPERFSPPGSRTADPSAGGQMPEEDS
ncbi:hypothetical protein PSPO01_16256 [Paraphaeosphaeria sporulosa]